MATDYGTDLAVDEDGDLDVNFGTISGRQVVAEDIRRRFSSPRRSVFYAEGEGIDLRDLLNESFTAQSKLALEVAIAAEARKDERVVRVRARIDFNAATKTMKVTLAMDLSDGSSFRLVLAVDQLTVEILEAA
jgi:hypothetical protein